MSSLSKMISIIDLFSGEKHVWTAEDISEKLEVSTPTTYRYLKELVLSGLLARSTGGQYYLGSKIIELDYQIRTSDPVIFAGKPIMQSIRDRTGCDILLSHIYNDRILVIHEERTTEKLNISYTRGRSHPLFQSATSKVILAYLTKSQLENYQSRYPADAAPDWNQFKASLPIIRRDGYCISHGEIDTDLTALAAPVLNNSQVRGSLSLILPTNRFELFDHHKLIVMVKEAAEAITDKISNIEL